MKKSLLVCVLLFALAACSPPPTSSDKQRERQELMVSEGVAQVGVPAIKNFRELKLAKDIYEMRDQTGLVTYSYLENLTPAVVKGHTALGGKLTFVCDSIGYPLPYATQFTAPESMQTYTVPNSGSGSKDRSYGVARLPQSEPNGLHSPASADGTWVMCKDPNGKDARPLYTEPKVVVSQFKFPTD